MIYSAGCLYSLANMNISVSTVVCMVAVIVSMVVMSVMSVIEDEDYDELTTQQSKMLDDILSFLEHCEEHVRK